MNNIQVAEKENNSSSMKLGTAGQVNIRNIKVNSVHTTKGEDS
jgi:hypothetical protein